MRYQKVSYRLQITNVGSFSIIANIPTIVHFCAVFVSPIKIIHSSKLLTKSMLSQQPDSVEGEEVRGKSGGENSLQQPIVHVVHQKASIVLWNWKWKRKQNQTMLSY